MTMASRLSSIFMLIEIIVLSVAQTSKIVPDVGQIFLKDDYGLREPIASLPIINRTTRGLSDFIKGKYEGLKNKIKLIPHPKIPRPYVDKHDGSIDIGLHFDKRQDQPGTIVNSDTNTVTKSSHNQQPSNIVVTQSTTERTIIPHQVHHHNIMTNTYDSQYQPENNVLSTDEKTEQQHTHANFNQDIGEGFYNRGHKSVTKVTTTEHKATHNPTYGTKTITTTYNSHLPQKGEINNTTTTDYQSELRNGVQLNTKAIIQASYRPEFSRITTYPSQGSSAGQEMIGQKNIDYDYNDVTTDDKQDSEITGVITIPNRYHDSVTQKLETIDGGQDQSEYENYNTRHETIGHKHIIVGNYNPNLEIAPEHGHQQNNNAEFTNQKSRGLKTIVNTYDNDNRLQKTVICMDPPEKQKTIEQGNYLTNSLKDKTEQWPTNGYIEIIKITTERKILPNLSEPKSSDDNGCDCKVYTEVDERSESPEPE